MTEWSGEVYGYDAFPIRSDGGKKRIMLRTPFCWCGHYMEGHVTPFGELNWICPSHGNGGSQIHYVPVDDLLFAVYSNWELNTPTTTPQEADNG